MEELKLCPFCGSDDVYSRDDSNLWSEEKWCYVYCDKCGASTGNYKTIAEAERAWNKRNDFEYVDPTQKVRARIHNYADGMYELVYDMAFLTDGQVNGSERLSMLKRDGKRLVKAVLDLE